MNSPKKTRLNQEILVPAVRLIASDGQQVGVVSIQEALIKARAEGLDLVEISPTAEPPVCRIMDYNKYLFDLRKKKKVQKIHSHLKEVKLRPVTGEADFQVKLRNIQKFLKQGDRVKVSLFFRGREVSHQELGMRLMERIVLEIEGIGAIEQPAKLEGRQIIMLVIPKKGSNA